MKNQYTVTFYMMDGIHWTNTYYNMNKPARHTTIKNIKKLICNNIEVNSECYYCIFIEGYEEEQKNKIDLIRLRDEAKSIFILPKLIYRAPRIETPPPIEYIRTPTFNNRIYSYITYPRGDRLHFEIVSTTLHDDGEHIIIKYEGVEYLFLLKYDGYLLISENERISRHLSGLCKHTIQKYSNRRGEYVRAIPIFKNLSKYNI